MAHEKWEDVTGDARIGGDDWSKNWKSRPHVVPSPGQPGARLSTEKTPSWKEKAHTIPSPVGVFYVGCGRCPTCLGNYQDLCKDKTWVGVQ